MPEDSVYKRRPTIINLKDFYKKEGSAELDKAVWEPEWKLIKNRPRATTLWEDLVDAVTQGWGDGQWIVKTTTPASTALIQQGKTFITSVGAPK